MSLTVPCPLFFFFQAEDGIRDTSVTGVQTCALPIYSKNRTSLERRRLPYRPLHRASMSYQEFPARSEERRVGKECRSRWAAEHCKKKRQSTGWKHSSTITAA